MLCFTRRVKDEANPKKSSFVLMKDGVQIAEIILLEKVFNNGIRIGVNAGKDICILRSDIVKKEENHAQI